MLCNVCKIRDASVQVTHRLDGVLVETHLCSDCTRQVGLSGGNGPIGKLVGIRGKLRPRARAISRETKSGLDSCSGCGLDFKDFKKSGRLGCPHCYDSFADRLMPVVLKFQGSREHRGKRAGGQRS